MTAADRAGGVLVTGFGRFPGVRLNPTERIVSALGGRGDIAGRPVFGHVFETVYEGLDEALRALVVRHRPAVILHFGVAARSTGFRLERRARNFMAVGRADAAGHRPASPAIRSGGPAALAATVPVDQMLQLLRRRGLPAAASIDAGDYLCNALYYLSLYSAGDDSARPSVGFLHVPYPAEAARTGRDRPTLAELISGAGIVAEAALVARRRIEGGLSRFET